jgi:hypothetical protein
MGHLKKESIDNCFSLISEYIEQGEPHDTKRQTAALALGQLRRITAGTGTVSIQSETVCTGRPRFSPT